MASVNKRQVLTLYKSLLRESQKFDSYNFRNYAIRRVRDAFRENKSLADNNAILSAVAKAQNNLDIVRRQAVISKMYSAEKLVIEHYLIKPTSSSII